MTATSVPRGWKGASRWLSRNRGSSSHGRCRADRPVESLDVADLQLEAVASGGAHQCIGLGQRGGERLLHEYGDAAVERVEPDLRVDRSRDGDADRLDLVQQVIEIRKGHGAAPGRYLGRPGTVVIVDPHQMGVRKSGEVAGVMLTQGPDPDHSDGHPSGRAHAGTPRPEDSTKAMKRSTSGSAGSSARARSSACPRFHSELKKSR